MIHLARTAACVLGLLVAQTAKATEYRRIELADGRTVVGQVAESTPEALVIELVQGRRCSPGVPAVAPSSPSPPPPC